MLDKINSVVQLWQNMGSRYMFYRSVHELEKRTGILEKRHPGNPPERNFIRLKEWQEIENPFGFESWKYCSKERDDLKIKFEKIIVGDIQFFNKEWKSLGEEYDWITNPDSGFTYDKSKHWSKVNDFDPKIGDIKFVWEKSRFSYLLSIMRYDEAFTEDHSEFVFKEISDWIEKNPINLGPNWKCSQEISLRILNWTILLHYYKNSEHLNDILFGKIQNVIYWSLHHVYKHINFSRIAVRNNHAITETLFLTLSNALFPFIPETTMWSKKGKKWFEQEIEYQVYEDGTFLQFSMNYHRVVIQLFSLGLTVAENSGIEFNDVVYERAYKSVNFLYQSMEDSNGNLPNYGSNDGALFFPLSDFDYRDYRPQLSHLHFILTGQQLFNVKYEDQNWLRLRENRRFKSFAKIEKLYGMSIFQEGGYYLIRDKESFTFLRCGSHKDRPAHADNLHIDVWVNGINVLRDSGTYKYNTTSELSNYFTGTIGHNTSQIEGHNQMLKGSRFIWYNWSQVNKIVIEENDEEFILRMNISAFRQINSKITHERVLKKSKKKNHWRVSDKFYHAEGLTKYQNWNLNPELKLIFNVKEGDKVLLPQEKETWYSSYYGVKEKSKGIKFRFNDKIETEITI